MKKKRSDDREVEDKIDKWARPIAHELGYPVIAVPAHLFDYSALGFMLGGVAYLCVLFIADWPGEYLRRRKARRRTQDGEHNAR